MPLLDEYARATDANAPEIVGIALDEPAPVASYLATTPVFFRILLETPSASDSSVGLGNHLGALPFSVLIGADGRLVARHYGPFHDSKELRNWTNRAR